MAVHPTPRRSSRSRKLVASPFRRRFAREEPDLDVLLDEPLTHLIMRADGVDRQDLVSTLNKVADKLQRQEIGQSRAHFDAYGRDENKYRRGVGIILLNARDEMFVGRRRDVKGNAWQLPQGGIDDGETPSQAALRELKEEIGTDHVEIIAESKGWLYYDVTKAAAKRAWDGRWCGQCQKWFAMRLLGPESEIDIATAHPEFDRWQWITMRDLPHVAVSFKRQLYLSLVGEFGQIVDT